MKNNIIKTDITSISKTFLNETENRFEISENILENAFSFTFKYNFPNKSKANIQKANEYLETIYRDIKDIVAKNFGRRHNYVNPRMICYLDGPGTRFEGWLPFDCMYSSPHHHGCIHFHPITRERGHEFIVNAENILTRGKYPFLESFKLSQIADIDEYHGWMDYSAKAFKRFYDHRDASELMPIVKPNTSYKK